MPEGRPIAVRSLLLLVALLALGAAGCASSTVAKRSGGPLSVDAQRLILVTIDNRHAEAMAEPGSTLHGYTDSMPYTVSAQARATTAALSRDYHLIDVREWPITALKVQCVVFGIPVSADRAQVLRRLASDRRVLLAEPMQLFAALADGAPVATARQLQSPVSLAHASRPDMPISEGRYNDPYYRLQYAMQAIHAAAAQRWSQGEGISVAVIDTGIDVHHPDLHGHVPVAKDFVDSGADGSAPDRHGTAVAGIVAALANNGVGIVGVAPSARVLSFKACEPLRPQSLEARCNSFTLALALAAAIDAHAQVVNLSLGGPDDPLLTQLVETGEHRGMLFVGAVPGSGQMSGFPVSIPGVVAVDRMDRPTANALHAPGTDILSLAPEGKYDFVSGSSFAAAQVSAALALLRVRRPHADAVTLERTLRDTSTDTNGVRVIDVCAALQALEPEDDCRPAEHMAAARP